MSIVRKIVEIVDRESPELLDKIACEDSSSKEELVRKVLSISHGQMVRTHQNASRISSPDFTAKDCGS